MDADKLTEARKKLEQKWDSEGECGSCGWHAALYEHAVFDEDIEEALLHNGGVLWLPCHNKDYPDNGCRGVEIDIT